MSIHEQGCTACQAGGAMTGGGILVAANEAAFVGALTQAGASATLAATATTSAATGLLALGTVVSGVGVLAIAGAGGYGIYKWVTS